jgi:hypothetical protein
MGELALPYRIYPASVALTPAACLMHTSFWTCTCVCVCVCVCACVFIVVLCMDFNGDKSCILWRTLVSTNSAREREQHNIYQCIYALMVMMYAQ